MEDVKKTIENTNAENKNTGNCCHYHYKGFWFVKALVLFSMIIFIFVAGIAIAKIAGIEHSNRFGMKNGLYSENGQISAGKNMMFYQGQPVNDGNPMMRFSQTGIIKSGDNDRIFGNITKIEDNKITVLDNSNKEQTFITKAATVITLADKEVGYKDLKTGQNIIFTGAENKDKVFEADTIAIQ